jgi:ectoine hydroxylase-related dioxygenase (phytanoyl-CoA dioxygenase family)
MLTAEQKHAFERDGFLVLERVLEGEVLSSIQAAAKELVQNDKEESDLRIWHERALFRRPVFRRVLDQTKLIEAELALLGEDAQLLALDLLATKPGKGGLGWHRDVNFVCNKTLSINTGIYLQDMTEDVGPLRVVPGSHRWEELPSGNGPFEGEIQVPVKAGDAVLFDAGLWHSGDANRSEEYRLGLFAYFGRYWIKRMDNYFTQPLPAELSQTDDPLKRQLLGLGLRPGVASYHGDDEGYNRRGEAGIDFVA